MVEGNNHKRESVQLKTSLRTLFYMKTGEFYLLHFFISPKLSDFISDHRTGDTAQVFNN